MSDDDDAPEGLKELLQRTVGEAAKRHGLLSDKKQFNSLDEIVAVLKETAVRYNEANPYRAGDLVTPRPETTLKWAGEPHIVLHALPNGHMRPEMLATSGGGDQNELDISSPQGYPFCDVRVAKVLDGRVVAAFWGEAWMFEPWTPDMMPEEERATATIKVETLDLDQLAAKLAARGSKAH